MAHTRFMLDKESYTHAHAQSSRLTHARERTHKCVRMIAFHGNNVSRTRLSVVLYVQYIVCLVWSDDG